MRFHPLCPIAPPKHTLKHTPVDGFGGAIYFGNLDIDGDELVGRIYIHGPKVHQHSLLTIS